MTPTRRRFLGQAAATTALGLADVASLRALRGLAADDPSAVPARVQYGPDIEPIVRLIEETPRGGCVAALVDQLRTGLPYERFLAGVFFAGIRRLNSNHDVYKIQPVHQVSMEVSPEERLLPLFWAVEGFKRRQEDFPNPPLTELKGPFPLPEQAADQFARSFEAADLDGTEQALVVLAREQGPQRTMEQLWPYGCRNGFMGGHAAIVVASCFRALETLGWRHGEPVLRFVLRDVYALGGRGRPDPYFLPNAARADRHLATLPHGWSTGRGDRAATLELVSLLRRGEPDQACALALEQLQAGGGAQPVWDAVHLAAAELMVRSNSGLALTSRPLHSNTSAGALHYAFRTSAALRTQLLLLLQAVAWTANKTSSELHDRSLRDIVLTELAPPTRALPAADAEAVEAIFALLPARHYDWNATAQQAVTLYGNRADADEASRLAFSLLSTRPQAAPLFLQAARSWLCRKASNDAHDYKFPPAILESTRWVSAPWQPHLLAASVHYLHGARSPDHPVVVQAREAVITLG
jgi:hypothetical protein